MRKRPPRGRNSRAQLLSQWKTFLQQSVVKWQEFTGQFQASEAAHQAKIQQARLKVKRSQRRFDHASKSITTGEDQTHVISDEEQEESEKRRTTPQRRGCHQDPRRHVVDCDEPEGAIRICRSLEQRVKRPRKNPDEEMGEGGHFG